jgi:hypothetical protein
MSGKAVHQLLIWWILDALPSQGMTTKADVAGEPCR